MKAIIDEIIKVNNFDVTLEENTSYLCCKTHTKDLTGFITHLKEDRRLRFAVLIDLFAVDFPSRLQRFEIVYNLLSLEHNQRITVKTYAADKERIQSVAKIFSSSIWYEREIFDMFGVKFDGNPDLRRILTDYGFSGHPLRKDFPVSGYVQVRYDSALEKVINEPVKLQQAFRDFDFLTPWQSSSSPLPGDEKAPRTK